VDDTTRDGWLSWCFQAETAAGARAYQIAEIQAAPEVRAALDSRLSRADCVLDDQIPRVLPMPAYEKKNGLLILARTATQTTVKDWQRD
jgi:hypothetical protein